MKKYYRGPWLKIADVLSVSIEHTKKGIQNKHKFTELVQKRTSRLSNFENVVWRNLKTDKQNTRPQAHSVILDVSKLLVNGTVSCYDIIIHFG